MPRKTTEFTQLGEIAYRSFPSLTLTLHVVGRQIKRCIHLDARYDREKFRTMGALLDPKSPEFQLVLPAVLFLLLYECPGHGIVRFERMLR